MACPNAHNSPRRVRRCTGSEIGMAPCAEQTNSWEVSWISATAHPACPPCAPCLHIKDPSTNTLPPKLLPTTLGCTHTCIVPSCVRPGVYFSTGSSIRPLSHLSLSPVAVCPSEEGLYHRCCAEPNSWFTFQAKRVLSDVCLVRHLLRAPSRLYHAQSHLDRWRLLRWTLGSSVRQYHKFQQRAREQLSPFVVVCPFPPQRQFAVHCRLRFDVPRTRLP